MKLAKQLMNEVIVFQHAYPEQVKKTVDLCKIVKRKAKTDTLIQLVRQLLYFYSIKNSSNYIVLSRITDIITNMLTQYFDKESFTKLSNNLGNMIKVLPLDDLIMHAMDLNTKMAVILEHLGLPGEAYNYLMKGYDPYVIKYDPRKQQGDATLDGERQVKFLSKLFSLINRGFPGTREMYIRRAALNLRLRSIFGDVNSEGLQVYEECIKYTKFGHTATTEDIRFMCTAAEFFNLFYRNRQELGFLLNSMDTQATLEIGRKSLDAFDLLYTLTEIKKNVAYAELSLTVPCDQPELLKLQQLRIGMYSRGPNLNSIRVDLIEFLNFLHQRYPDPIQNLLKRQSYSKVINEIVVWCLQYHYHSEAVEFAHIWRTFDPGNKIVFPLENTAIMLTVTNLSENRVVHLIQNNEDLKVVESSGSISLHNLLKYKDKIEGGWTTSLEDQKSFQLDLEEYGIIDSSFSKSYKNKIAAYYNLDTLCQKIMELPEQQQLRVLELPWANVPLVPILSGCIGRNVSSLATSNPAIPRTIKKLLIWCDPDETLTFSILEKEFIVKILEQNAIPFDLYEGAQNSNKCTKEVFLEKFADPQYDLIWLMCHGEFNADNPPHSKLIVEKDNPVFVHELLALQPISDQRRLMVLNACQSSTSNVRYNSMGFMGIGPLLTSDIQSVIGHLWLTDFRAGAIFGVLLMEQLISGVPWGQATVQALSIMQSGNHLTSEALYEINPNQNVISEYSSQDISQLIYSCSAIFYD